MIHSAHAVKEHRFGHETRRPQAGRNSCRMSLTTAGSWARMRKGRFLVLRRLGASGRIRAPR